MAPIVKEVEREQRVREERDSAKAPGNQGELWSNTSNLKTKTDGVASQRNPDRRACQQIAQLYIANRGLRGT